jgi:hypothetical protein
VNLILSFYLLNFIILAVFLAKKIYNEEKKKSKSLEDSPDLLSLAKFFLLSIKMIFSMKNYKATYFSLWKRCFSA